MKKEYFKLFANCIPVKGARRSLICDVQRGEYEFIPNALYDILTNHTNKTLSEILLLCGENNISIVQEYISFLESKEYIFWCSKKEKKQFPALNLKWDSPCLITNSIIDIKSTSVHDFENIFTQLDSLGCKDIQLRSFDSLTLEQIDLILKPLHNKRIKSVELLLKYDINITNETIRVLYNKHPRIRVVAVHSSPLNKVENLASRGHGYILFLKEAIVSESHCGVISPDYFNVNINLFTESINHNSCLNRKLSIDFEGNIKNCPSSIYSYGNIRETGLKDVIQQNKFKKIWEITKDQIEICKDCEFRYICTDCRVYIEDSKNIYSKPLKCNYNPYTAEWENN